MTIIRAYQRMKMKPILVRPDLQIRVHSTAIDAITMTMTKTIIHRDHRPRK